jgi:uncharacterized membrane protein YhaH (DUF805 family)
MDMLVSLYTTTTGRISRKTWWLGVLGMVVASIVLSLILSLIGLGISPSMPALDAAGQDPAAFAESVSATMRASAWGGLIMFAILAYPSYCLSVKRRHDRDNSGRDLLIYLGLSALVSLLQAFGLGFSMTDIGGGVMMPAPAGWFSVVLVVLGIYGIYMLVVLGFLPGTAGANSYGPDPLTGATEAAA